MVRYGWILSILGLILNATGWVLSSALRSGSCSDRPCNPEMTIGMYLVLCGYLALLFGTIILVRHRHDERP